MFSAGQYQSTEKKVIYNLCYVSESITFSNLNLTEIFILIFIHLRLIPNDKLFVKKSGFEPLITREGGGATQTSDTKKHFFMHVLLYGTSPFKLVESILI